MPRYTITLANGTAQPVDGHKFSFYLENIPHWFVVHREHRNLPHYVITEKSTGFRVQDIPRTALAACQGDEVAAAKNVLKSLANQIGEARIRGAIIRALANHKQAA